MEGAKSERMAATEASCHCKRQLGFKEPISVATGSTPWQCDRMRSQDGAQVCQQGEYYQRNQSG